MQHAISPPTPESQASWPPSAEGQHRNNTPMHAALCRRLADPVTVCRKARRGSIRVLKRGPRRRTGGERAAAPQRVREPGAPPGPRLALQTGRRRRLGPSKGQALLDRGPVVRNGRHALPGQETRDARAGEAALSRAGMNLYETSALRSVAADRALVRCSGGKVSA